MTTIAETETTCALCGARSTHPMIASTSTFGASDLDTRPAEVVRSSLCFWVAVCPTCGYAGGPSLAWPAESFHEGSRRAIERCLRSATYRRQRRDPSFPDLANRFLCRALIEERIGDHSRAGWSTLHAAWACDDAGEAAAAVRCRLLAAERFQEERAEGGEFAEPETEQAIIAETLRRAGRHAEAVEVCDEVLAESEDEGLRAIVSLVRRLAERGDDARHTVDEAFA